MTCADDRTITVCDRCLTAACWYGEFMCQDSYLAGTTRVPVRTLRLAARENPEYWSLGKLIEVYGRTSADGGAP